MKATWIPARLPNSSSRVRTSASAWQGWCSFVSELITGIDDAAASSSTDACAKVRMVMASRYSDNVRAVSPIASPRPIWSSSVRSTIGSMPSIQAAASKLTRVRVDGLWKIIPSRPPARRFRNASGSRLSRPVRSSNARSSPGSSSSSVRKWRGGGAVIADRYLRRCMRSSPGALLRPFVWSASRGPRCIASSIRCGIACRTARTARVSSRHPGPSQPPPLPRVLAGDTAFRQGSRKTLEALDGHVEGRDPKDAEPDALLEVDADTAAVAATERHVAVTEAHPDADRRDPQPRALDPPRGQVGQRRVQAVEAEARIELAVEVHVGVARPDTEESQQRSRPSAEADREALAGHVGVRLTGSAPSRHLRGVRLGWRQALRETERGRRCRTAGMMR